MVDFLLIFEIPSSKNVLKIKPDFKVMRSNDLMIRGGAFYAIWVEERGMWSTDEQDLVDIVDKELDEYAKKRKETYEGHISVQYMSRASTRVINDFHNFCKNKGDMYHALNEKIIFANTKVTKRDYASFKLSYAIQKGDITAYNTLISKLYSPEERMKIEWAIGSVITGDSKKNQKFIALYGRGGTGKSTVIDIIDKLFNSVDRTINPQYADDEDRKGYCKDFHSKDLGSSGNSFAMEQLSSNPLVAVDHEGDLSNIEDNTRLNSLVSHDKMTINEKFKSIYSNRFKTMIFIATNNPVKITDAKSGIIRRLIDVSPTGERFSRKEYDKLKNQAYFELGAIAYHCQEVYLNNKHKYDDYIPTGMFTATNDFYNFILERYFDYKRKDYVTLTDAYEQYNKYCEEARVYKPMSRKVFGEELKNYFKEHEERATLPDGTRARSCYLGFKSSMFKTVMKDDDDVEETTAEEKVVPWLDLKEIPSKLDILFKDCPAQYASDAEMPTKKWEKVKTTLKDLDTSKLHYVLPNDTHHIFVDFDFKDENGNKSLEKNIEAASEWSPTYAEVSKGGGLHLHYNYTGDPSLVMGVYSENVEIKKSSGKSSIRRRLTKCNDLDIATISSGLPLKGEKVIVDEYVYNEKGLRTLIQKGLQKEYPGGTICQISLIKKALDSAYNNETPYDVSDLRKKVFDLAESSTHHSSACLKMFDQMKFKSQKIPEEEIPELELADGEERPDVIFDIEVLPNLLFIGWKYFNSDKHVVSMYNPQPETVIKFIKVFKLFGFNCRKYDNHILYSRGPLGHTIYEVYQDSCRIIKHLENCFYGQAYNISEADILDYSSEKQSLKKFEIQLAKEQKETTAIAKKLLSRGLAIEDVSKRLGYPVETIDGYISGKIKPIPHKELEVDWNEPLPEDKWPLVAEYCKNDVLATEALALSKDRQADWSARKMLAAVTGMTPNTKTNRLTAELIFQKDKNPQRVFNYRNLAFEGDDPKNNYTYNLDDLTKPIKIHLYPTEHNTTSTCDPFLRFMPDGTPYFPGYTFDFVKKTNERTGKVNTKKVSMYRGEEVGEGGYVYSEPGIYYNVALLDISSMHPTSIIQENLFGPYTERFADIKAIRVAIKHKDFEAAKKMFDGALAPYLEDEAMAKELSFALKIAINSVYGLTSASFEEGNPFKDPRNVDNIVAKRGALFMVNLKHAVQAKGFTVAHIKTDSIKIPNATPEIIKFVQDYGKLYGYDFEHEATYERMCLVNDAVYIAKYDKPKIDKRTDEEIWWTATGKQFQVPYVFKKLFSKEDIYFWDLTETKSVTTTLYIDKNTDLPEGEHNYCFVGKVGDFCPVKEGYGGGHLCRLSTNGQYYKANGAGDYLWADSDDIEYTYGKEAIDMRYFDNLAEDAIKAINKYGDFEMFVNGEIPN